MHRLRIVGALALLAWVGACATTTASEAPAAPVDNGTAGLAEERDIRNRVARGEGEKVRAELQARLADNPRDTHIQFLQTVAGMPSEESWKQFKRAGDDTPTDPWPVIGMGQVYVTWKMYPQAQQSFTQAGTIRPGYVPVALGLAEVQRLTGDAKAKDAYLAILQTADVPEAHAGLGLIALQAGDTATAQKELSLAAKGDPGSLETERALGKLLVGSGDTAGAIAALKAATALDPRDGESTYQLAKLEQAQGDVAGAFRDFSLAAQLKGIDLDMAQRLVDLADQLKDPKALDQALDQLAHVDKTSPTPLLRRASLALDRKDQAGAESRFKEALERAPGNADAQLALARIYRDSSRIREAVDAYRAVLATPGAPPAAQTELDAIVIPLKLSAKPIGGDVNKINVRFSLDVDHFYRERLKEKPALAGKLRVGVDVNKEGKVTAVTIKEDTVHDDLLALHALLTMQAAEFPKQARRPEFEVELKP